MTRIQILGAALSGWLSVLPIVSCENLPGTAEQQGAVGGGVAGATAGAVLAEDSLLGALIGGVLGAGAGWLIGAQTDKIRDDDEEGAREAIEKAQNDPATAADVQGAATADLNFDGFVTLDEVVAMEEAGLSDQEMIDMLEDTGQIFELTANHRDYLLDSGVSRDVVEQMNQINREARIDLIEEQRQDVISQPNR